MAQTNIINNTAFKYETLFATDEKDRPIITPIIKGTFTINLDGSLVFNKQQAPVNLEGEHYADPATSSYLYEPECAFIKLNTDVIILGDAISKNGPVKELLIDIQVGSLSKQLSVFGNRYWVLQNNEYIMSPTEPFETLALIYENAYGGWDKRAENQSLHDFEARNTVGKGFYVKDQPYTEPLFLANIEDPSNLINSIDDRPNPMGCGFTLPHWQPRVAHAGTYDDDWLNTRSPRLPNDFKRDYFNAASGGLISNGYLLGNEPVSISNMTPEGLLSFNLPNIKSPKCKVELKNKNVDLDMNLDTIIINTRTMTVSLIWRNMLLLNNGFHDAEKISIEYG